MKSADYYRYHDEMMSNGTVVFPNARTLACFMAGLMSKDYHHFMTLEKQRALTEHARAVIDESMGPDMQLVREETVSYIVKELKWSRWTKSNLVVDTHSNSEMYDFILGCLGRSDAPKNVFSPGVRYTISGKNRLTREVI